MPEWTDDHEPTLADPRWPMEGPIDPAHLIPRSLGGCGDTLCVVLMCRVPCHRAYDRGELDLLPYLEPACRAELAHAVGHVGLVGALAGSADAVR